MLSFTNILKIGLFVIANLLFGFIIYFLSLRPLGPSEEQLIINYNGKDLRGFIIECFIFILIFTTLFSSLSYLIFKISFKNNNKKLKVFLLICTLYFVFSILCSLEYFFYIKNLIYK
jgi:hypothetical protein